MPWDFLRKNYQRWVHFILLPRNVIPLEVKEIFVAEQFAEIKKPEQTYNDKICSGTISGKDSY